MFLFFASCWTSKPAGALDADGNKPNRTEAVKDIYLATAYVQETNQYSSITLYTLFITNASP